MNTELGIVTQNGNVSIYTPDSTAVKQVIYDADTKNLDIQYIGGKWYRYRNVSDEVFQNLVQASSVGKFVNKNIIAYYEYDEIHESDLRI